MLALLASVCGQTSDRTLHVDTSLRPHPAGDGLSDETSSSDNKMLHSGVLCAGSTGPQCCLTDSRFWG